MKPSGELIRLAEDSLAAVLNDSGELLGSAFFINDTLLLTAAHVVGENGRVAAIRTISGDYDSIRVRHQIPARREAGRDVWPTPDLAVLEIRNRKIQKHAAVCLTSDTPTRRVTALGYSLLDGTIFTDQVSLELDASRRDMGDNSLLRLLGRPVAPGMSGGMILCHRTGRVAGVIKSRQTEQEGVSALAVSGATLKQSLPDAWAINIDFNDATPDWKRLCPAPSSGMITTKWVSNYLHAIEGSDERVSRILPENIRRKDVRQPTRVVPLGARLAGERQSPIGQSTDDEPIPPRSATVANEHTADTHYWDPLRSPWPRIAILAGPGAGKSWLLSNHAASVASKSAEHLSKDEANWQELRFPIYVEAGSFARLLPNSVDDDSVLDALVGVVRSVPTLAASANAVKLMLREALRRRTIVLCIDGLDETPTELRSPLTSAIALLSEQTAQTIIGGRPSVAHLIDAAFPQGAQRFTITNFNRGDVTRFIDGWFGPRRAEAALVNRQLRENRDIWALAGVPLLLAFMCKTFDAERGVAVPRTRGALYKAVALSLLSGAWRESAEKAANDGTQSPDSEARLGLLSYAVGQIMGSWRARRNEFSYVELDRELRKHPDYSALERQATARWRASSHSDASSQPPADPVIWEYIFDGLLTTNSLPSDSILRYRFLHMVLLELCVAQHLASLSREECLLAIDEHRWFDGDWSEVIPLVFGLRPSADLLDQTLLAFGNDPWGEQSSMAVACVVEGRTKAPRSLTEPLSAHLLDKALTAPIAIDRTRALKSLIRLVQANLPDVARSLEVLLATRVDLKRVVGPLRAALAVTGQSSSLRMCREWLNSPEEPIWLRIQAGRALCAAEDERGVALISDLLRQPTQAESGFELELAQALGDVGGPVLAASEQLLTDATVDPIIRVALAIALANAGGEAEYSALALIGNDRVNFRVQCEMTMTLLEVGHTPPNRLTDRLVNNPNVDSTTKARLVEALLRRGRLDLLGHARDLIVDTYVSHPVRRRLADTMIHLGEDGQERVRQVAIVGEASRSVELRFQSLTALLDVGDAKAIEMITRVVRQGAAAPWAIVCFTVDLVGNAPLALDNQMLQSCRTLIEHDRDLDGYDYELIARCMSSTRRELVDFGTGAFRSIISAHEIRRDGGIVDDKAVALLLRIGKEGAAASRVLSETYRDSTVEPHLRIRAFLQLAGIDADAAGRGISFMDDSDIPDSSRERLLSALGTAGTLSVFDRLLERVQHSSSAYTAMYHLLQEPDVTRDMAFRASERANSFSASFSPVADLSLFSIIVATVSQMSFPGTIEAERSSRRRWFVERVTSRCSGRLSAMLLPSEFAELTRARAAAPETADPLVLEWFPEFPEMVAEEVAQLQAEVEADPSLFPDLASASNVYEQLINILHVLRELNGKLGLSVAAREVLVKHASILSLPAAVIAAKVAASLDQGVKFVGTFFLIDTFYKNGLETTLTMLDDEALRFKMSQLIDDSDGELAYGAACLGLSLHGDTAVNRFYGGIGLALSAHFENSAEWFGLCAEQASVDQAIQGAATLRTMWWPDDVPRSFVERMASILDSVGEDATFDPDNAVVDTEGQST